MKCPKCGYLGFEDVERCRNCGYDFSLSVGVPLPELTIRRDTRALTPIDDLSLIDSSVPAEPRLGGHDMSIDLDRVLGAPDPPPSAAPPPRREGGAAAASAVRSGAERAASAVELPLFGPPIPDDEPLITRASPPRAPLAVRRSTPDVPRVRAETPRPASFDLVLEDLPRTPTLSPADRVALDEWPAERDETAPADAAVGARLVAVLIDLVILAVIDAAVIYFTMQICGLTMADVGILPKGPLIAFLFVQNGGYLVAFTAGGQTLGKMAAGIRVVPADADAPLDLGRAFLRTSMWVLLAVPAGLGFVSTVVSRDHRGLHDRFAGTRVVRT
jgi:uncharacterized RDD family membrane protein YckC